MVKTSIYVHKENILLLLQINLINTGFMNFQSHWIIIFSINTLKIDNKLTKLLPRIIMQY